MPTDVRLDEAWDDLADRAGAAPWVRPGWVRAWHDSFGSGPLELVLVRRAGELVGVLPLERRGRLKASPTNWHTPEFDALALDDEAAQELAERALAARPTRTELRFVDAEGRAVAAFEAAARRAGYRTLVRTLERSPYVLLRPGWEEYVENRSGKLRRDLRRRQRRLEELGAVSLEIEAGHDRLDDLLEEAFRLEAAGWKGRQGTAILSRPETEIFYRRIAAWAASRDMLRLVFLRLSDRAVAFELNIDDGRRHYNLKRGHDEGNRATAPGKLITWCLLEQLHGRGLESYELLGDEEPFKRDLADDVRIRLSFQVFAPTATGRLEDAAHRYAFPLARRALAARRRRWARQE